MPKVLVLATSRYSHGGISSVVMAHERSREWHDYGCRWIATHRSGSKAKKIAYFLGGMMSYLLRLPSCDIVHMHIGEAPSAIRKSLFMKLAKLAGKKTVVHFHAFDTASTIEGEHREVYRRLFDDADRVVVLSEMWKKAVCRTFDIEDKVRVLYNPCPEVGDSSVKTAEQAPKRVILSAGVVNNRKGYKDLIRAFAMIAPKYPDWRVMFAGSGEIEKGRALASELGVGERVDFPGWMAGEDKDRVFREATVFCLPSYAEGFPMAVLDAWAYGLPVVATPVGGLPDIVEDGRDVLLFKPGDCQGLAMQLEKIITDAELRKKITLASKNFAKNTFNIKTIGRHLGDIYGELSEK